MTDMKPDVWLRREDVTPPRLRGDTAVNDVAFIDGRDALMFVIVRPAQGEKVSIESGADGMDKKTAAWILRHLANQWDPISDTTGGGR
jgi:hypothetical protein